MQAVWKNQVLAQSTETQLLEGNHYFPAAAIHRHYFKPSTKTSVCPWKGTANYYDIVVDGETNAAAAWYYPQAKDKAKHIEGMVAFWRGVAVIE